MNRRTPTVALRTAPLLGDVGACEATIELHPWLHCWDCGEQLWHGETFAGAPIFVCRAACSRILDQRRVP